MLRCLIDGEIRPAHCGACIPFGRVEFDAVIFECICASSEQSAAVFLQRRKPVIFVKQSASVVLQLVNFLYQIFVLADQLRVEFPAPLFVLETMHDDRVILKLAFKPLQVHARPDVALPDVAEGLESGDLGKVQSEKFRFVEFQNAFSLPVHRKWVRLNSVSLSELPNFATNYETRGRPGFGYLGP